MTTPENQNTTQELEPFFPPILLLIVAGVAFVLTFIVFLLEGQLNVLGWAGLAVGILALIFWAIMNPKELMNFLRGRGLAFGGTAIVVTIGAIIAAVLVYLVVERQEWVLDFTEGNIFTIVDDTREVLEGIANDPTTNAVHLIGFFNSQATANQEDAEILLREFEAISGGKITYEFVNPDRQPGRVQLFDQNIFSGQLAVIGYDTEGSLKYGDAELISMNPPNQYNLINTIIRVLADGDFRVTFLEVADGANATDTSERGSSDWQSIIENDLGWTVEIKTPLELAVDDSFLEQASDGDVLIIPGGSGALQDETIAVLEEYVSSGGNIILLANPNNELEPTLAASDNMTAFLTETYGVSVANDIVVDPEQYILEAIALVANNYSVHPVTQFVDTRRQTFFVVPQSIVLAEDLPEGVTVNPLITTTENAYVRTDVPVNTIFAESSSPLEEFQILLSPTEDEVTSVITLAAAAENTNLNSRLVVFGSNAIFWNSFSGETGEAHPGLVLGSIVWTTRFEDFASGLANVQPVQEAPPDQVQITQQDADYINLVTAFLIPFGSLVIGAAIWWVRRDRVTA